MIVMRSYNFGGGVVVKYFLHVWYTYFHFHSIAELSECQVPLAMRTDVIDQALAMALHPLSDCQTANVSVDVILNLTESPETHIYIVRKEVVESMLEICEQKQKIIDELSSQLQQGKMEDLMAVSVLKYVV